MWPWSWTWTDGWVSMWKGRGQASWDQTVRIPSYDGAGGRARSTLQAAGPVPGLQAQGAGCPEGFLVRGTLCSVLYNEACPLWPRAGVYERG